MENVIFREIENQFREVSELLNNDAGRKRNQIQINEFRPFCLRFFSQEINEWINQCGPDDITGNGEDDSPDIPMV